MMNDGNNGIIRPCTFIRGIQWLKTIETDAQSGRKSQKNFFKT